jgi:hypothetical protein
MHTVISGPIRLAHTHEIPEGQGREFKVGERYKHLSKSNLVF